MFSSDMRFFGKSKEEKMAEAQAKQALKNWKDLKQVLTALKENRDQIEKSTGRRPDIDDTTKLVMQKVLNVWISEGRDIDDEKFWEAVDYNKQFDYPVEYYERWFFRKYFLLHNSAFKWTLSHHCLRKSERTSSNL